MLKSAVAVISGGLDSCVSLAIAKAKGVRVKLAIFFDYGQRSAHMEQKASLNIARFFDISYKVVKLPWLKSITKTSLVNKTNKIPIMKSKNLNNLILTKRSAKAVWVPNRNGVFVNIAAAHAESLGAEYVVTGFDKEEARTFPDNSKAYIDSTNKSFSFSTLKKVKLVSFVHNLDKTQIIRKGILLGAPLEYTWSCYLGRSNQCSRCESCQRAIRAFKNNNVLYLWNKRRI